MFRKPEDRPKGIKTINVLLQGGGMGDLLAALPTVNYIKTECTWLQPLIWVPDYMVEFSRHVLPKGSVVQGHTEAASKFHKYHVGISTQWVSSHTPMRTAPLLYAANMLIDGNLPKEHQTYLQINPKKIDIERFNIPTKYICISVGATNKAKMLPVPVLNSIINYVADLGYTPVLLGNAKSAIGGKVTLNASILPVDTDRCLDLTGKTSLLESAAIIDSSVLIGMEGGLTHLAGFTKAPIIAGYSFVDPNIMMPIRNGEIGYNVYPVVPDKELGCRFCQSQMPLMYSHDFRDCWYKDYKCVESLTFDKFVVEMNKVLNV